jgi:predicted RNase H-like HicB family nuclease
MPSIIDNKETKTGGTQPDSMVVDYGVNFFSARPDLIGTTLQRTKHLPQQIVDGYMRAALNRAEPKRLPDGDWFWEIPGFKGVWASAAAPDRAVEELREVLFDWLVLKIEEGDRDIPVIDQISLNSI